MRKRTTTIEWQIAQDDAEWVRLCEPPSVADKRQRSTLLPLRDILIWLILVGCAGSWWWYSTQAERQQVTAQVAMALQQERKSVAQPVNDTTSGIGGDLRSVGWPSAYERVMQRWQFDDPKRGLDLTLQIVEIQGGQAVVHVTSPAQGGIPIYHQTRFYQYVAESWVRSIPDAALWGIVQQLQTSAFDYHFRRKDAAAVNAAAPQIDALYRQLRLDFGLPAVRARESLVIDVSVTHPSVQYEPSQDDTPARINAPSPALYLAPLELSDRMLLEQSLALPLLKHVSRQARAYHAVDAHWRPLVNGLRLWELWELATPLVDGHEEVVQWAFADPPIGYPGHPILFPNNYTAPCATHQIWTPSPLQMGIPLHCLEVSWEAWYTAKRWIHNPLTRLDRLIAPASPDAGTSQSLAANEWGQTVAMATLIEYAVTTYGREQVPLLVAGLGQSTSWESLILSVYGLSLTEFESGWQAFLTVRYGL